MDERIRNLMHQRGHEHLMMEVDEPDLADKIVAALGALDAEAEEIRDAMGRTVARNLRMMARMGVYFEERVAQAISGVSDSHGRARVGGVSSAARPGALQAARGSQRSAGRMTFLERIFARLERAADSPVLG